MEAAQIRAYQRHQNAETVVRRVVIEAGMEAADDRDAEAFYQKRNYQPVWFERGVISARVNAAVRLLLVKY